MFYNIQNFSFANIDKFSTSSLVTRLTTDISNVQMAYMMIVRIAIRCPLMLVFAFVMAFIMGGKMAVIFLFVIPVLAVGLGLVIRSAMPLFKKSVPQVRPAERFHSGEYQGHARGEILSFRGRF